MVTRWMGGKDRGSRDFTPQERERFIAFMRAECTGRAHGRSIDEIAATLNLAGRTVRAIMSDVDGVEFCVVSPPEPGNRLYVAEFADDTEHTTAQLFSRAKKIKDRALRRAEYAKALPREQATLW